MDQRLFCAVGLLSLSWVSAASAQLLPEPFIKPSACGPNQRYGATPAAYIGKTTAAVNEDWSTTNDVSLSGPEGRIYAIRSDCYGGVMTLRETVPPSAPGGTVDVFLADNAFGPTRKALVQFFDPAVPEHELWAHSVWPSSGWSPIGADKFNPFLVSRFVYKGWYSQFTGGNLGNTLWSADSGVLVGTPFPLPYYEDLGPLPVGDVVAIATTEGHMAFIAVNPVTGQDDLYYYPLQSYPPPVLSLVATGVPTRNVGITTRANGMLGGPYVVWEGQNASGKTLYFWTPGSPTGGVELFDSTNFEYSNPRFGYQHMAFVMTNRANNQPLLVLHDFLDGVPNLDAEVCLVDAAPVTGAETYHFIGGDNLGSSGPSLVSYLRNSTSSPTGLELAVMCF